MNDIDLFNNLNELYALGQDIDYKKHSLDRVDISKKDAQKSISDYFRYITNNEKVLRSIVKYENLVYECDELNGGLFASDDNITKILIPKLNNVFSSSIAVHEYTHALCYENDMIFSYVYDEVLPFLNQFLYIENLKNKYDVNNLIKSNMDYMIHNQLLYNIKMYKDKIMNKCNDRAKLREHYKYIIGSLYSIVLYDRYKNDKDFIYNYSMLYDYTYNKDILCLLKYYDVDICDNENVKMIKRIVNNN